MHSHMRACQICLTDTCIHKTELLLSPFIASHHKFILTLYKRLNISTRANSVPSEKPLFGGNPEEILCAWAYNHIAWLHLVGENNRADWPPKKSYHHHRCLQSCSH